MTETISCRLCGKSYTSEDFPFTPLFEKWCQWSPTCRHGVWWTCPECKSSDPKHDALMRCQVCGSGEFWC